MPENTENISYAKQVRVWLCALEKYEDKNCKNYVKRECTGKGLCKYRRTYINDKTRMRFSICEYPRPKTTSSVNE